MADGKITFDTTIDNRQAEKDLKELEDQIDAASKKAEKEPESGMTKALDEATDAAGELQKALNSAGRARDEFGSGYNQEAMDFIENYHGASQAVNEMKQALEDAKAVVKDLESQGKWFGDEDYDKAAAALDRVVSNIKQYKKELNSPTQAANPFELDTYAGKIREAELSLQALENAGKGLGSKEFDEAYRKLALLKDEAKRYAAELSRTPAEAERGAAAAEAAMVAPLERQEAALQKQIDSLAQATRQAREHSVELNQKAQALQIIRDSAQVADERIVALNVELRTLQERLSALESAGVGPGYEEYDRISQRIKEINANIRQYQSGVKGAKKQTTAMASATDQAHASLERMTKRLTNTLKSALIFSVLYKGLSMLKTYMGKVMKSNAAFTAQLAQLKGALLTAFQPVMQVIIPALIYFMQILTRITNAIVGLMARITGKSRGQMAKDAKTMYDEAKAIDKVGSSAKAAGKQLASFDEINQLSGSSGGSGSTDSEITPNFDAQAYGSKLDELMAYIGGALLAIGVILAFSGVNIPLGLGLMAAGAAILASEMQENWGKLSDETKGKIAEVYAVVSAALLVLGVILAFSGANIPLGIGLILLGVAGMVTAVKTDPEAIVKMLQGPIGKIVAIVSGALLAIGIILVCSGVQMPLGIALIAIGAMGLATVAALNWDKIVTELQGPIGKIVALVSTALIVIGIILVCSGTMLPLGIALIAAGAAGLATVTALNWNAIVTALQGPIGGIVAIVSAALLVIGIILVCTGVGLPLGIALIAAGAAGLVTVTALNWNAISDKVKGVWNTIKNWWKTSVAKYFTLQFWKDTFSNIAAGLTSKIKDGINAAISLANRFIDWMNDKMHLEWGSFSLFGKEVIPSGSFQLLTLPNIPYLAQGAVIPPNREFMAVLGDQKQGTNIEAPLETIKQALAEVMAQYGNRGTDQEAIMEVDGVQFAKLIFRLNKSEQRRIGVSLTEV